MLLHARREEMVALLAAVDWAEEPRIARAHAQRRKVTHGLCFLTAGAHYRPCFFVYQHSRHPDLTLLPPPCLAVDSPVSSGTANQTPRQRRGDGSSAFQDEDETKVQVARRGVT